MTTLQKYQNRCQNRDFSYPDRMSVGIRDFHNPDEIGMVGQSAYQLVDKKMSKKITTSFPGSSLFLLRESLLVEAGHVSARFLQIPER